MAGREDRATARTRLSVHALRTHAPGRDVRRRRSHSRRAGIAGAAGVAAAPCVSAAATGGANYSGDNSRVAPDSALDDTRLRIGSVGDLRGAARRVTPIADSARR